MFKALDTNSDGFFSLDELILMYQRMGAMVDKEVAKTEFMKISEGQPLISFQQFKAYCDTLDMYELLL